MSSRPYRSVPGARELTKKGRRIVNALDRADRHLSGAEFTMAIAILIDIARETAMATPGVYEEEEG